MSLNSGCVPRDWRVANVIPIYKKGSKLNPLNYRPVSLTSVICKCLEKLIRVKMVDHLEAQQFFTEHQHGFRKGMSCLTQLLEFFSDVEDSLDEGDSVDVIYLDCMKAFDRVPHRHLLLKIEATGVRGELLRWISKYLCQREQRVVLRDKYSSWRRVWSGVPQGSVLGPTLFLIYINDLVDSIECKGKLFADDAKIYKRIRSAADPDLLQNDLNKLQLWSDTWKLKFHQDKCKTMHIGRTNPKSLYYLNDTALQETTKERDLGVFVSNDMKAAEQVG